MTASFNDMSILAGDSTFGNRVAAALWTYCGVVDGETPAAGAAGALIHTLRKNLVASILNNQATYKTTFVPIVAVNLTVANEAIANSANGSFTGAIATTILTVTGTPTGNALGVGQTVSGAGVAAGTIIASLGTGTGGTGTYNLSGGAQTITAEAMTTGPTPLNSANVNIALQAALILDADISNAIANKFNSLISGI